MTVPAADPFPEGWPPRSAWSARPGDPDQPGQPTRPGAPGWPGLSATPPGWPVPPRPPGTPPAYPPGTPPAHPPAAPPGYPPGAPPGYPPGAPPAAPSHGWMGQGDWPGRIYQRLLEQRIVLASGHLDGEAATVLCAQLLTLDAEGDGPVRLELQGLDAELPATLTVMGVLDVLRVPVTGYVAGRSVVQGPACWPRARTGWATRARCSRWPNRG